jgi:hypothetical protein
MSYRQAYWFPRLFVALLQHLFIIIHTLLKRKRRKLRNHRLDLGYTWSCCVWITSCPAQCLVQASSTSPWGTLLFVDPPSLFSVRPHGPSAGIMEDAAIWTKPWKTFDRRSGAEALNRVPCSVQRHLHCNDFFATAVPYVTLSKYGPHRGVMSD